MNLVIIVHIAHRKRTNFSIPNFSLCQTPSGPKVVITLEFFKNTIGSHKTASLQCAGDAGAKASLLQSLSHKQDLTSDLTQRDSCIDKKQILLHMM